MEKSDQTLESILEEFGRAIRQTSDRLNAFPSPINDAEADYQESATDAACDFVESILAAAFLVCQTKITRVTKWTLLAAAHLPSNTDLREKHNVRAIGATHGGTSWTAIEVIWATANLVKHEDDWPKPDWHMVSTDELAAKKGWLKQAAATISVLQAIGLRGSSTGNLRRAVAYLGSQENYDPLVLQHHIDQWIDAVADAAEQALFPT